MHKLSPLEVLDIQEGRAYLVDVRSIDEFNSGHAAYAINIPADDLVMSKIDKNKKIYVYCTSGGRSRTVEYTLSQKGYDAMNIGGLYDVLDIMGEA